MRYLKLFVAESARDLSEFFDAAAHITPEPKQLPIVNLLLAQLPEEQIDATLKEIVTLLATRAQTD